MHSISSTCCHRVTTRCVLALLALEEQPAGGFDGLCLTQQSLGNRCAHSVDQAADLRERLRLGFAQRLRDLLARGWLSVFADDG